MLKLFIALRYLRRRRLTVFAVLSVMAGATAFVVVMGVMDGYSVEFNRRSRDMLGDLVVNINGYSMRDGDAMVEHLKESPAVEGATAYVSDFGILKITKENAPDDRRFFIEWCQVAGIDPKTLLQVVHPELEPQLSPEDFTVAGEHPDDWIVLGKDLMEAHELKVGDQVLLVTSRQTGLDRVRIKKRLTVIGSLSFGLFEQDREMAFVDRSTVVEMRGLPEDCVTEIRVRLAPGVSLADGKTQVYKALGATPDARSFYHVTPFSETSNMFKAVESQRDLSRMILFFLFLVSGMAIIAVLFLVVLQKRHDIGVMRSVGVSSGDVARMFLSYSGVSALTGGILGVLTGWGILSRLDWVRMFVRTHTGFDPFPAHLYHLEKVPWSLEPVTIVMVLVTAVIMALLAGLIPAMWAAHLDPVESLRIE